MIKDEGGSAFPQHPIYSLQEEDGIYDLLCYEQGSGMTLRDYFAAKAMQGFCGNSANKDALPREIAIGAYLVAEAMMKEREE